MLKNARICLTIFLFLIVAGDLIAQSAVIVFDLSLRKDTLVLSNPVIVATGSSSNVVFHPTASLLFYSVDDLGKNTVRVFDGVESRVLASGNTYSDLAVTSDGKDLSVLQRNSSGGFDLVKYPLQEGPGVVLVPSAGFTDYAWVDDNSLIALFPGKTNELRLYTIRPKKEMLIAQNIGEVIQRFFNTPSVTFIHKQSFTFSTVKRIGAKDGKIDVVIDSAPEQSAFTWTPNEILISSDGSSLFSFNPKQDQDWKPVIMKDDLKLTDITSLTVNSTGDKLALTARTDDTK
jgi:hypothetical protein